MDIWISIYNLQMANNLVKWWKTKFLNGYKQFSECGKISDTEGLLERFSSEDDLSNRLRTTTPPIVQSTQIPTSNINVNSPKKQNMSTTTTNTTTAAPEFNFEEFSCDVSVENSEKKPGQDRQEFSFTLYDFDGHGKITKDDIAGLVTTIYDALGSSVKVPHYGSKTIKVKLTVSPDQSKRVSATIINQKDNENENNKTEEHIHYKRDLNVTISQGGRINDKHNNKHNKRHTKYKLNKKKYHCCNKHELLDDDLDQNNQSDDNSDVCSRISGNLSSDEEEEGECIIDNVHYNNKQKKVNKKFQKLNSSPKYTIPNLFIKDANINQNNCTKNKSMKKRSGSLQRQELIEIIQANMEKKNNTSFQASRKHPTHVSSENKQNTVPTELQSRNNNKTQEKVIPNLPLQYLANIVDPTHLYVDLDSLQNTSDKIQYECNYNRLLNAVMSVSNKKNKQAKYNKKHNRLRSDLNNIPFRYQQFLQYPMINDENKLSKQNKKSPKHNINDNIKNMKKNSPLPHVAVGHSSSPHHLKHRNRQEDQARAMAQVVNWLEQEFSSNLNMKDKQDKATKSTTFTTQQQQQATSNSNNNNKDKNNSGGDNSIPSSLNSGIERHEYHHVHEHIHHHYHHYQESPLVV